MSSSKILQKLAAMEKEREGIFQFLGQYTHAQHNQSPAKGGWSAIQVVQHLLSAETSTLHYLKKKTADVSRSKKAGVMAFFRSVLLNTMLALPLKFKAPAIVAEVPASGDLQAIQAQWAAVRAELQSLLASLSEADYDRELFLHPVAGKLNLYQMLDFMQAHIQHHLPQIHRTIKEAK